MIGGTPQYLHHYTSIESLACILKYQSFRFTRLDCLNDPLEGKSQDLEFSENLVFCSSWTAQARDTIPLWRMYSGFEGIRIKMPCNMFAIADGIEHGDWGSGIVNYSKLRSEIIANATGALNFKRILNKVSTILGPDSISYVPEKEASVSKTISNAISVNGTCEFVNLSAIGLYKNDDWAYEKEWRYRLPYDVMFGLPTGLSALNFCKAVQFEKAFLDVPLNNEAVNNIEVMLGPLCTDAHEIIVSSLLNEYASNPTLTKSKIAIK